MGCHRPCTSLQPARSVGLICFPRRGAHGVLVCLQNFDRSGPWQTPWPLKSCASVDRLICWWGSSDNPPATSVLGRDIVHSVSRPRLFWSLGPGARGARRAAVHPLEPGSGSGGGLPVEVTAQRPVPAVGRERGVEQREPGAVLAQREWSVAAAPEDGIHLSGRADGL